MYTGRYVVDYPGAIDSFEYPRHESAKHLILQHNKSWYNKYYTHQGVALHDANDVITNTTQREFSVRLTLITMKLKLNLFKKLANEDKHIIAIIIDLIGCVLFVVALYYGIYWCLKSWALS